MSLFNLLRGVGLSAGAVLTVSLAAANVINGNVPATTWTGSVDNVWNSAVPGNWSDGLPDAATGAVFPAQGVSRTAISVTASQTVHSLVFPARTDGGIPLDYAIVLGGERQLQALTGIHVGAGAGQVTIDVGSNFRFLGDGATGRIVNDSDRPLTLDGRLHRTGGFSLTLEFDGSGDTILTGGFNGSVVHAEVSTFRLAPGMGGRVIVAEGMSVNRNNRTEVHGGTLVLDGSHPGAGFYFHVGGEGAEAVLTGRGEIGRGATAMPVRIYSGGVVDPGRSGAVGTLRFADQLVDFQAGSTVRLDLLNPGYHDRIEFLQVNSTPSVTLATGGAGVELDLRFFGSRPAGGEYVILSGYGNLTGRFAGWENGVERTLDGFAEGYRFRVDYGPSATTLTVIPGPERRFGIDEFGFAEQTEDFELRFAGLADRTYRVEVSDDLIHWNLLTERTTDMDEDVIVVDVGATERARRFYRVSEWERYGNEANPAMVQRVESGEIDWANAAWWGFDPADATDALQAAIQSGARELTVPDMGTPWMMRETIRLAGNQTIRFKEGTVVEAIEGRFLGIHDFLFAAVEVENLRLEGGGSTLRMRKSDYQNAPYAPSEWRHLIGLFSAKNVEISGLILEASGGDGIYIGVAGSQGTTRTTMPRYCENIVIRDVICRDNHRQGISVISVRGLLIENTILEQTSGAPPQAGIDFEPFRPYHLLQDIVMRNCLTRNNAGAGYVIWVSDLDEPISILLENCRSEGDRDGLRVRVNSAADRLLEGWIDIIGCSFEGSTGRGIAIEKPAESPELRLIDCEVIEPAMTFGDRRPVMFYSSPGATDPVGGVHFENLLIQDPLDRIPFGYVDHAGGLPLTGVTGNLILNPAPGEVVNVDLTPQQLAEWISTPEWIDLPRLNLAEIEFEPVMAGNPADYGYTRGRVRSRGADREALFAVYAPAGESVTMRLRFAQLASFESGPLNVRVTDQSGTTVHQTSIPFQADTDVTFAAVAGGLYFVTANPNQNLLSVIESTHRVNIGIADERVNLKTPAGDHYFWVPRHTEEFAVEIAGDGSNEGVQVELINPAGEVVYHRDNVTGVQQLAIEYPGPAPSVGEVWILRISRPSTLGMHFGDVYIDLRGIPPLLAPSPEALLRPVE